MNHARTPRVVIAHDGDRWAATCTCREWESRGTAWPLIIRRASAHAATWHRDSLPDESILTARMRAREAKL